MSPTREEALFALALEKPVEKRAAWLDAECEGDAALHARLEALLAAHEATSGILGNEPVREVLTSTIDLPEPAPDEAVGMTLGRYKLREKLGEGGCGTVNVAEQTEPVRRRVALNVGESSVIKEHSCVLLALPRKSLIKVERVKGIES